MILENNLSILWCGNSYYGSIFKVGCNYYSELLARQKKRVLFVCPPVTPFHNKQDNIVRFLQSKKGIHEVFKNYFIYVPFTLIPPFKKLPLMFYWIIKIWHIFTYPNFKRLLKKNNFCEVDILVIDNFVFLPLLKFVKYKKLIVRITDRLDGFNVGKVAIKAEINLIKSADKVIYTSSQLRQDIEKLNQNCFYVPNGVEFNKFQKDCKRPEIFNNINKPVAIYVGAIDEWFDFCLLDYVAQELKNIHFLIIGSVKYKPRNFNEISNKENVTFYGKVDNAEIASFLKFSDVGIIPFRLDMPLVHSISPLKLYEYMACGIPVVATKWDELVHINSPARLAIDASDFIEGIVVSIQNKDTKNELNFAKNSDWSTKISEILS